MVKVVIVVEITLLGALIGFKTGVPDAYASMFRAYESQAPESFIITVQDINMQKEGGEWIQLWSGSEEVDLTKVSALADVKTFAVNIPAGKYQQFKLTISNKYKVKGSVAVGGTTYYTKTGHAGFQTGPAELEELTIGGMTNPQQALTRGFDPVLQIGAAGASASDMHVLVDFSNFLTYSNGQSPTPTSASQAGMYLLNYLPYAITFGQAAKKEVYDYTSAGQQGTGRLTVLYDAADQPVRGSMRKLFQSSTGNDFHLYGWLFGGNFGQDSYISKNNDGTLNIRARGDMQDSTDSILFPSWQRATHTGSFTSTVSSVASGTYTATRVE